MAINPLDKNNKVPVFFANFVLMDYGFGAVFGCPAHDQRDFDFAKKYKLKITTVVKPLNENDNFSELVDICLAKNEKKLINIINENNFSNEDTILIIRIFLSKTKRLIKINDEVSQNKNLDKVLTTFKPPIFWKDKDLVKQQIKNYSKENLELLMHSINKTELLIKKNYNNAINILLDFILDQGKEINN